MGSRFRRSQYVKDGTTTKASKPMLYGCISILYVGRVTGSVYAFLTFSASIRSDLLLSSTVD